MYTYSPYARYCTLRRVVHNIPKQNCTVCVYMRVYNTHNIYIYYIHDVFVYELPSVECVSFLFLFSSSPLLLCVLFIFFLFCLFFVPSSCILLFFIVVVNACVKRIIYNIIYIGRLYNIATSLFGNV